MATRTIANGGGNWGSTGTWVEGAVPTSADDVVATGTSGQLTIPTGTAATCKSIDFTNYTNTFTYTAGTSLTVAGNIKFVSAMTLVGSTSKVLTISAASTMTSSGKTIPWSITFNNASGTKTLADAWTVSGDLILQGTVAVNGFSMTIAGSLGGFNGAVSNSGGTTDLILNGTGTWSAAGSAALVSNLTINTAGTITISGTVLFGASGKTLTYTAGTVVTTGSTLNIGSAAATLNTNGIIFNNITHNTVNPTITLNSTLNATGTLSTFNGSGTLTFAGTAGFTVGSLQMNSTNSAAALVLKFGNNYIVTSSFVSAARPSVTHPKISSNTGGSKVSFVVSQGASTAIGYMDFTDVDATGGRTIWTFNGVLSNTTNIRVLTDIITVASA